MGLFHMESVTSDKKPHSGFLVTASVMDDAVLQEFARLRKIFPRELARSLRDVGFALRRRIIDAIRKGGPNGKKWTGLSLMHKYQRFGKIMRGHLPDSREMMLKNMSRKQYEKKFRLTNAGHKQRYSMAEALTSWKSGGSLRSTPLMRMSGSIRYEEKNGVEVSIGALFKGAARYLSAVQDGLAVNESGRIVPRIITPRMRRFFWLARIPLKKGKTQTMQHKRPLIRPIFDQYKGAIHKYIQLRVQNLVVGPHERRDETLRKAGLL